VTGFFLHPTAPLHDAGWGHLEHQGRLRALASAVGKDLLTLQGRVAQFEPRLATLPELLRVHAPAYLDWLRDQSEAAAAAERSLPVGDETWVSGDSWEAALGSAGAVLEAVERISAGEIRNAFVAARPPGNQAGRDQARGFCLVNQIAVAARHLQATGRARRIAIVDWGARPPLGTQALFDGDASVFLLSLHEGDLLDWVTRIRGAARLVQPDFILVSAGYDALKGDPRGGLGFDPWDFHTLTREVLRWAEGCGGRLVVSLEGGFQPRPTGEAVVATVRALAGIDRPDPLP
jgi:acetoin utilization deacetylase AcuC-like enzyme